MGPISLPPLAGRLLAGVLLAAPAAVGAAAVPLSDPIPVFETAGSLNGTPSVATADDGRFLVVWPSASPGDGNSVGVRARKFTAANAPFAEFVVNAFTTGLQNDSDVDMNAGGDFTIVWASQNQASATSLSDLVARQSSAGGTLLGTEQLVETSTAGSVRLAGVASDPTDGFVTAWARGTPVLTRQFGPGFSDPTTELSASPTDGGNAFGDVGVDAERNFVVVWTAPDADGAGIFGRLFGADGTTVGPEFPVNLDTTHSQARPRVAMAANGEFVVVWYDIDLGTGLYRIEMRRFAPNGTPRGSDVLVSPLDEFTHLNPDVDSHPDGAFVVVWTRQVFVPDDGAPPDVAGPVLPESRVMSREYDRLGRPLDGANEETATPADALSFTRVAVSTSSWITVFATANADGLAARRYLRRTIFADNFDGVAPQAAWSHVAP